jgi:hypothetical protein
MNFSSAENPSQHGSRSGQRQCGQDWRGKRNLRAQAGVRRRADRANMVRSARVFRMRMHSLCNAHRANQRHSEHTNHSHHDAPSRKNSNHWRLTFSSPEPVTIQPQLLNCQLDDFKLRWSRSYR